MIGVEQLSRFMDPTDRGTAFIFADGAGAVVVGPADATGHRADRLGLRRLAVARDHPDPELPRRPLRRDHPVVQMEGTAVFRWAPFAMAEVAHEALRLAGVGVDDLDAFIPHQANLRITQTLARNIKLPESVAIATDVVDSGNTSAASVPLAMEAMLRNGEAEVGRHRAAHRVRRGSQLRRPGRDAAAAGLTGAQPRASRTDARRARPSASASSRVSDVDSPRSPRYISTVVMSAPAWRSR